MVSNPPKLDEEYATADKEKETLTTASGAPVADNQNSLAAGPKGPMLIQDWPLFEKHAHFNRERIPERVVHAKGSAAYGTLTITNDITRYSRAKVFSQVGKKTECFLRCSTVAGERGAADAERDVRGFGSHTYSLINPNNERFWVKFHFKSMPGIQNLTDSEAAKIIGEDRESHQRDLFEAIERKGFPKWRFCVQIMPEADAEKTPYNPFDLAKIWPHKDYPLMDVGIMELNRNPENHFAEVEKAAFEPSNVVPGVSFSPDKMLQLRIFAYADAHRYRLGSTNYADLPVNKPRCPVHHYHRDGIMRADGNYGGAVNYEPNSFGGPVEDPAVKEPPLKISGDADRYDHRVGNDDYTQAGNLFRLMSAEQKNQLIGNIVNAMKTVPTEIKERQVGHFYKADPAYGEGVAKGLGLPMPKAA